jgi:hypothetical protein
MGISEVVTVRRRMRVGGIANDHGYPEHQRRDHEDAQRDEPNRLEGVFRSETLRGHTR